MSSGSGKGGGYHTIHGYVDTPSAHFTWGPFTAPGGPGVQTVTMSLVSDGDMPLDMASVTETTSLARSHMTSTNCIGVIHAGSSCSISIYYDPTRLAYPTGLMYDTLTVTAQSNSPQAGTFSSHFTIRVRVGDND